MKSAGQCRYAHGMTCEEERTICLDDWDETGFRKVIQ